VSGETAAADASPARAGPDAARQDGPERMLLGVGALLASTVLFPTSDIASKYLTAALPPIEITLLRYVVFCIMVAPLFARSGDLLRTARPVRQVMRAVTSVLSAAFAITALRYLPVAESTAIIFASPIFVTALAVVILGEKVGVRRWVAALVGLVGVLIIVQPGTAAFRPATLIPLVGAGMSASAIIATRLMARERINTTMAYSAFVGTAILAVLAAPGWVTPNWPQLQIALVSGFFATLGNLAQILAYRHAPASLLSPFIYTQLIFAAGLGYLVFGNVPGPSALVGAAVIAASGMYTAWRERVRAGLTAT
jgi:drug/metabolite transporter (DMT)-like permease